MAEWSALSFSSSTLAAYQQDPQAVGGSLLLSALLSALPLVTVFVLLGGFRLKAQWAALAGLAVALVVAVAGFGMPVGQSLLAASHGAVFGLFPILWIVVNALWVYNMTVATGHFDVLRRSFGSLSSDTRTQAILVAFCFGGLLEALAGFGAPVAITSVMLMALGFRPIKAAVVALVANTAPVAFGAMGVPVITLARVSGLPLDQVASVVGRQTPLLAVFVPLILVFIVDGRRGLREAWAPALVCGVVFAIGQFATSNFVSVELTDIVASFLGAIAIVLMARLRPNAVWAAREPATARASVGASAGTGGGDAADDAPVHDSPADIRRAYAPYVVIVAVFALAQVPGLKGVIDSLKIAFSWPGLDVVDAAGKPSSTTMFSLTWLSTAGTLMVLAGILVALLLRVGAGRAAATWWRTVVELRWAILTVTSVLALAYVMNASAQTTAIGLLIAGAGGALAFLSPVLGWFAVAVTGSDTSANALFGSLQVTAANGAGLPPDLLAAANSSGGVLGKMLSPQNLTIAAVAVKMEGEEGTLLRKVIGWSLGMLVVLSGIIALQATPVLGWMLP
ncbi:L-lactate permease [Pseudonocardia sp. KRD291]|uniref:L-lactate permease n=1 Tax=Pseudonocardia sp. KRD291 TaxID=2792007 RepID=UPI001C49D81B|nr:L-lactate permease [Pseudonocardia sp. KRD291]MBW0105313.1 L-lactate permease [Pseudonocardia sp. KRD291]